MVRALSSYHKASISSVAEEAPAATINMSFKHEAIPGSTPNAPYNFQVFLTFHLRYYMDFHPVFDYKSELPQYAISRRFCDRFYIRPHERISINKAAKAVERIFSASGTVLINCLTRKKIRKIARYIESKKTELLETDPFTIVADMSVIKAYIFKSRVSSRELIPVQIKDVNKPGLSYRRGPCAVCLEGFGDGDEGVLRTCCSHMFHSVCIGKWLTMKGNCPMCRSPLIPNLTTSS